MSAPAAAVRPMRHEDVEAVEVALDAGLVLSPDGPLFARGPAPRGAFRPGGVLL